MAGNQCAREYACPEEGTTFLKLYRPTAEDHEDGSPYFRIRWRDRNGKVHTTSAGRTMRDAEKKIREIAHERSLPGDDTADGGVDRKPQTIEALLEEYLDPGNHRTRTGRQWSLRYTEQQRGRVHRHIRPHLPLAAPPEALEYLHFVRILNHASGHLAPSTVTSIAQTCRGLVTYAQSRGVLKGDPMQGISYGTHAAGGCDPQAVDPTTIPTDADAWALADALDRGVSGNTIAASSGHGGNRRLDVVGAEGRWLQPLLVTGTGLRNGELFALRPTAVDLDALTIRVDRQLIDPQSAPPYFDTPKHDRVRDVVFPRQLAEPLARLIEHRIARDGEDCLLFPAPLGGPERRSGFTRRMRPYMDEAGWPRHMTWYHLRHLFAVRALRSQADGGWGLDLADVSRLMGHHSPEFTARRYLRVTADHLDRARQRAQLVELPA